MKSVNAKTSNATFEDLFFKERRKSENTREIILSIILIIIFVISFINSFYLDSLKENLSKPFVWFVPVLAIFLIRAVIVRRINNRWQEGTSIKYQVFRYVNAIFEISIPTLFIIIFANSYNPIVSLITPIVLFYFIFILLSIFELDFKLSVFIGVIAFVEYIIVVNAYYQDFIVEGDLALLNLFQYYLAKAVFLLLSGFISGFMAIKIKQRIISSFHALDERSQLEKIFGQQVSKEIVDEFIKNKYEIKSTKRDATVMFLDIRDFSNFCEGKTPEEINKYQNEVLSFMIDIVKKNRGIVNQILGDGFMVTFGAPVEDKNHTDNAVKAASEIIRQLNFYNEEGKIPKTNVGIGLHCGEVVTGNVGTEDRKQYSVTGNTVILAARLEQLNKEFNSSVIVSKDVIDNMQTEGVEFISLGDVNVKGFTNPIEVYKLL